LISAAIVPAVVKWKDLEAEECMSKKCRPPSLPEVTTRDGYMCVARPYTYEVK